MPREWKFLLIEVVVAGNLLLAVKYSGLLVVELL